MCWQVAGLAQSLLIYPRHTRGESRVPAVSPDPDLKSVNGINGRHADIQIGLHNPDQEQ